MLEVIIQAMRVTNGRYYTRDGRVHYTSYLIYYRKQEQFFIAPAVNEEITSLSPLTFDTVGGQLYKESDTHGFLKTQYQSLREAVDEFNNTQKVCEVIRIVPL